MSIDDIIAKIRVATAAKDLPKIQPLCAELRTLMAVDGRSLSGPHATQLVDALAGSQPVPTRQAAIGSPASVIDQVCKLADSNQVNTAAMRASWDRLYQMLADPDADINQKSIHTVLKSLKSARAFSLLAKTADRALTRLPNDFGCLQHYAQALIDDGQMRAAIEVTRSALASATPKTQECDDLLGMLGRAYKQIYVDNVTSSAAPASVRARFKPVLEDAIKSYASAYDPSVPERNYWHGINVASLLFLARQDGQSGIANPTGLEPEELCKRMLASLGPKALSTDDAWIFSTVAECHLMLGDSEAAAKYFGQYLRHPSVTPFMLFGTVRQLEQVLRLTPGDTPGGKVLAALKEAQIRSPEGKFSFDGDTLQQLSQFAATPEHKRFSETIVPGGGYVKLGLLQTVVSRAAAIAALCTAAGMTQGTGFLVVGKDLKPDWGDDLYLVTNAHVLSDPTRPEFEDCAPLRPDSVKIVLQGANNQILTCARQVRWQSAIARHDVAIIKVTGQLVGVQPIPVCDTRLDLHPGDPDDAQKGAGASKVSVIGYPLGGPLSLSVIGSISGANGMLVDLGARKGGEGDPTYLHYRAPTEPGNSGSPVFEAENWTLVGLHHEGFDRFEGRPKLEGKPGRNFANEGISINSIRRALVRDRV